MVLNLAETNSCLIIFILFIIRHLFKIIKKIIQKKLRLSNKISEKNN
jgi:hypothetical protein